MPWNVTYPLRSSIIQLINSSFVDILSTYRIRIPLKFRIINCKRNFLGRIILTVFTNFVWCLNIYRYHATNLMELISHALTFSLNQHPKCLHPAIIINRVVVFVFTSQHTRNLTGFNTNWMVQKVWIGKISF